MLKKMHIKKPFRQLTHVALALGLLCGLAACDVPTAEGPIADIGTRAYIRRAGHDLIAEITDIRGNLVKTDFFWRDETIAERELYRGLYAVSGREYDQEFYLNYPEEELEAFFPLKLGAQLIFDAALTVTDQQELIDIQVTLTVKKKTKYWLGKENIEVFLVDIVTAYPGGGQPKRNLVYYAPKLSMVLKSVFYEEGRSSFWKVDRVDRASGEPTPRGPRRSGSVMI